MFDTAIATVTDGPAKPVYARLIWAFRHAIEGGRLAPGDRLPTETALARQVGVHRLTVSRAYDELRAWGIIEQRRGRGSFVTQDALRRLSLPPPFVSRVIHVVAGEDSPAKYRQATAFITLDILAGLRESMGPAQGVIAYASRVDAALLNRVKSDDAVLCVGPGLEADAQVVQELLSRRVPMVSAWSAEPWLAQVPHLAADPRAGDLACRHLVERGYRSIGFIGRKQAAGGRLCSKFASYVAVLHECGLDLRARHIFDVSSEPGEAFAAATALLADGELPEAIFIDTDYKALEVLCALRRSGLQVPRDIGIVAYDGTPESAAADPPLTTVRPPRQEVGRRAGQIILDWNRQRHQAIQEWLPAELLVRASTRPL
jgi:DNA-binding LacI/PurR family transcriptional regulator/DNA-binding transcriptional regulator YhcF (GntR family)